MQALIRRATSADRAPTRLGLGHLHWCSRVGDAPPQPQSRNRVFWPWPPINDATHDCGMNDLNPEWMLELEESAEGESIFRPPGEQLQIEQARDAEAAVSTLGRADLRAPSPRGWQRARTHRSELQAAMERLEATVARPAAPHHRWADAVEASLMALEDALRAHIREVEGIDGLLAEIVDMAPRLAAEVETIKKEHVDLVGSWVASSAGVERRWRSVRNTGPPESHRSSRSSGDPQATRVGARVRGLQRRHHRRRLTRSLRSSVTSPSHPTDGWFEAGAFGWESFGH